MNQELISTLSEKFENSQKTLEKSVIYDFNLSEVEVTEDGLKLDNSILDKSSTSSILNLLKVKTDFPKTIISNLSNTEWHDVIEKLKKSVKASTKVYQGVKLFDENKGIWITSKILEKNQAAHKINYSELFASILKKLKNSTVEYKYKSFDFNPVEGDILLEIMKNDTTQLETNDIWNIGNRYVFSPLKFQYLPIAERLVCSNGNTITEYGFKTNISQKKFDLSVIVDKFEKTLNDPNTNLVKQKIFGAYQRAISNKTSVREFLEFKKIISNLFGKDLTENYLNSDYISNAYNVEDISKKSRKWQSTASAGIKVYDMYNLVTYVASHEDLEAKDRLKLEVDAANYLYAKEWDLEGIAQANTNFEYPKHYSMN